MLVFQMKLPLYCRQYKLEMIVHKSIRIIRKRFIPLYCWRDENYQETIADGWRVWTGARFKKALWSVA